MKTQLFFKHVAVCATMLFLPMTNFAQEATFQGLGYIHDGWMGLHGEGQGVSYDGSVVTGVSSSIHNGADVLEAFRWTESDGIQGIGAVSESNFWSFAMGISEDGSTIIGHSRSPLAEVWEAFRWTESEGMTGLGDLASADFWSQSLDCSADGSVVVGRSYTTNRGFRWTETGGMEVIEEEGTIFSEAWGISGDGLVVVGTVFDGDIQQGFRWTETGGMTGLGAPAGGYSIAHKASFDASVIVGAQEGSETGGREAFRWTEAEGMVGLGHLPGGNYSEAKGLSNDGSIVVGIGTANGTNYAFVWTESEGMKNLQEILENDYGLDLGGWTLNIANAISGDGSTIVGTGIKPDGDSEAWRVTLPNPLSVSDFSSVGVSLYPNPTTGIVNLRTKGTIENVMVYNLAGQKMSIPQLNKENSFIDLSAFSNGMYFIQITVDVQTEVFKVIKK